MKEKQQGANPNRKSFSMKEGKQTVRSDLKMGSNELHSHSDGSGPQSVAQFQQGESQNQNVPNATRKAIKAHKKRSRKKGRKNAWFFRGVWLCVVVLLGVGIAQFCITCLNDMLAFGKPDVEVTVELKKDATTQEIADVLAKNGLISNKWAFCTYSAATKSDGQYEFGTFVLNKNMDYQALINNLQKSSNRLDVMKLTFTEGMSVTQIASAMEDAGVCTADEFLTAVNDESAYQSYQFIVDIPNADERTYLLEGYLFPDTYEFYKGEGAANAIEKILNNTRDKLTASLKQRADAAGMTIDQMITLASMIQKEAANAEDMLYVSSVFHNRLNDTSGYFKFLNSDATIWYPYASESDVPDGFVSDYNTYVYAGLPVGPICNPGMDAIEAALSPADTDYYYFCHDADGNAYYAETEAEHQVNLELAGLTE